MNERANESDTAEPQYRSTAATSRLRVVTPVCLHARSALVASMAARRHDTEGDSASPTPSPVRLR